MQAVLVMFRSDGERRSFSIARDMTVIGRREDCDLRIPLGEVSRKHCRLVRDGDSLRLEDLGSSNGTFHNGERVQEVILNPGDSVQVGPVLFVLQIDGVPADEELQPFSGATTTEEEAPVAVRANDLGPLSPTAQSEADGELAPLPMSEDELEPEEPLALDEPIAFEDPLALDEPLALNEPLALDEPLGHNEPLALEGLASESVHAGTNGGTNGSSNGSTNGDADGATNGDDEVSFMMLEEGETSHELPPETPFDVNAEQPHHPHA